MARMPCSFCGEFADLVVAPLDRICAICKGCAEMVVRAILERRDYQRIEVPGRPELFVHIKQMRAEAL